MIKVLSIGEIMVEMADLGGAHYQKSFAGDTFNMAHYMNLVSAGAIRAEYLTALGQEAESEACLQFMRDKGVATTRCLQLADFNIGLFILSNDASGEKQYGYWRGQSAARHLFDQVQDLSGYDLVYFSGITGAIMQDKANLVAAITAAAAQGAGIAFDFNYRARLWNPEQAREFASQVLPAVAIAKISDEELAILYPSQSIDQLSRLYPAIEWVLTCSGSKAEVWNDGALLAAQQFVPVAKVVDSSAAGDGFIATYLAAKLQGLDLSAAIRRAHQVAVQVVGGKGSLVAIDISKLDSINA